MVRALRRPRVAAADALPPYVFALVSLDGGPTIMANVLADDLAQVAVGRRVRLAGPVAVESGRAGARFVLD